MKEALKNIIIALGYVYFLSYLIMGIFFREKCIHILGIMTLGLVPIVIYSEIKKDKQKLQKKINEE